MQTTNIPVEKIHLDPEQPRETYRGIDELADSMNNAGFQPDEAISVWHRADLPDGEFMVIDGHRRTQAAKKAGLHEIPCFIFEGINSREVWEKQLIANANREDLSIMNRARSFQRSIDVMGFDVRRVAAIHGISVQAMSQEILLCNLPPELQKLVDEGVLQKEVGRKIAELHESQMREAWVFARAGTTAKERLANIEAFINKKNQISIFKEETAKMDKNDSTMKAKKASVSLENAVKAYANSPYGKDASFQVCIARKRELQALEETAKLLKKISDKLIADIRIARAEKEINAPKQEATNA